MREAFVHEAVLVLEAGAGEGAPGAAITVALCGHWEHPGPCPLAPHHTRADRDGEVLRIRTLFATEPAQEDAVRRRIEAALAGGRIDGRDGTPVRWEVRASRPGRVRPEETGHASRLAAT